MLKESQIHGEHIAERENRVIEVKSLKIGIITNCFEFRQTVVRHQNNNSNKKIRVFSESRSADKTVT